MISFKSYKFEFPKELSCPVCNKKLHNPESLVAGMGPVCHKKMKFIEKVPQHQIIQFAHYRKNPYETIKQNKTLIIKNSMKGSSIAHIIYVNKDEQTFLYLDRSGIYKDLSDDKLLLTDIYYKNIMLDHLANIDFVSEIDAPQTPDLRRAYFAHNKEYSIKEKEQIEHTKELIDRGLNKIYQRVFNKDDMTDFQKESRIELLKFKESTPEIYDHMFDKGLYQKATFLARLKHIKTKESQQLALFMLNDLPADLIIRDYGLTDDEILNGLKHSDQKTDGILFSAYISANRNIMLMINLCEKMKSLKPNDRSKVLKVLYNILKSEKYTSDDLKRDLKA